MRKTSIFVALTLAAIVAPAHADQAPVAFLAAPGDHAFWSADASPKTGDGLGSRRDYRLAVTGPADVLRVALDYRAASMRLDLIDPRGEQIPGPGGWYSREIFVDRPMTGTWIVRASGWGASGTAFRMRARLEGPPPPNPEPPVQMLPNLRMVPPFELTFSPPSFWDGPLGRNCSIQEVVETSAGRCLRFSAGPGNQGPGPLMIRFAPVEGVVTRGTAYQRIYDSDGAYTERAAGEFEYHKTHMHYHHSGFGALELLRVQDPVNGVLVPAGSGPKQGFCTGDVVMWEWERFSQPREQADSECVDEAASTGTTRPLGTSMALTAGWADLYHWSQDGMYVEWGSSGDGLYVIRASADSMNWILETDESDNTSYTYLRVTYPVIQVLERGYGSDPWDPSKVIANDLMPLVY